MSLTIAQADRAAGVLLGQACGDALGVPYEFGRPPGPDELAEMTGGGLGDFAPGEWSDDTSMAVAVAEELAEVRFGGPSAGSGLEAVLDAVAERFLRWYDDHPPDIGIQTRAVLSATAARVSTGAPTGVGSRVAAAGLGALMTEQAAAHAARHPRSAGNGALMRTSPVALFLLDDRAGCAEAARAIASLTHADPLAGDSCVLWSEAVRAAVLEGRICVEDGLDLLPEERRDDWRGWIREALAGPAARFNPNGFTVHAFQAALAAVVGTPIRDGGAAECLQLQDALQAAVRVGHDTDTVAAIAGGLLGARWGASAIPWRWRRAVHGWPGRDARDLVSIATLATRGGHDDDKGWPTSTDVHYDESCAAGVVPHPLDPGVLLGTHRSRDHGATAVVSLCRVGRQQACFDGAGVVVESRLMDKDDPAANPNLAFAMYDAADAVRGLRKEGHTVLLHCVAAQQRTPSVAVAYSVLRGEPVEEARAAVLDALETARGHGALWEAAGEVKEQE